MNKGPETPAPGHPLDRFDTPAASAGFYAAVVGSVCWAGWAAFESSINGAIIMASVALFAVLLAVIDARIPALFRLVFVLASTLSAGIYSLKYWPERLPFDELIHFFTNWAATSGMAWILFAKRRMFERRDPEFLFIAALAIGTTLGIVWEAVELAAGVISRSDDMMLDLLVDLLAALAAGAFLNWAATRTHQVTEPLPVAPPE